MLGQQAMQPDRGHGGALVGDDLPAVTIDQGEDAARGVDAIVGQTNQDMDRSYLRALTPLPLHP
jgi:hypothetical protein